MHPTCRWLAGGAAAPAAVVGVGTAADASGVAHLQCGWAGRRGEGGEGEVGCMHTCGWLGEGEGLRGGEVMWNVKAKATVFHVQFLRWPRHYCWVDTSTLSSTAAGLYYCCSHCDLKPACGPPLLLFRLQLASQHAGRRKGEGRG